MKNMNSAMATFGWFVVVVVVCALVIWGLVELKQSGYDKHASEVSTVLEDGKTAATERDSANTQMKSIQGQLDVANKNLEAAAREHESLASAFKALVDIARDSDECRAKSGYDTAKCKYDTYWFGDHLFTLTAGDISVQTKDQKVPVKYEFVRDAKGDIVDFKAPPPPPSELD